MGKGKAAWVVALALFAVLALQEMAAAPGGGVHAASMACDPAALTPCTGAIMLGAPVAPACCDRLRAQQACLCQYARDRAYSAYVNSPRAQIVVAACGIPRPKC